MKRFLLFFWADYEGLGGWNDLVDYFDSIEESRAHPRYQEAKAWPLAFGAHIVDMQTGSIVERIGVDT